MPRSSGTYSLPAGNPVVTGTTISSSTHNTTMSDIATALTASLAKDGQTTPSANLPMGTYRHTGVGNALARDQYASVAQVQDGSLVTLSAVSGTNTITATAPLSVSAYASGQCFRFVAAGANTGAATININSIGAKSITKSGSTALVGGDIPSGAVCDVVYDGTRFQLLNPARLNSTEASNSSSITLPDGHILKFGNASASGTALGNATVTFPVAFPIGCQAAFAIPGVEGTNSVTVTYYFSSASQASFTISRGDVGFETQFYWFAIGY